MELSLATTEVKSKAQEPQDDGKDEQEHVIDGERKLDKQRNGASSLKSDETDDTDEANEAQENIQSSVLAEPPDQNREQDYTDEGVDDNVEQSTDSDAIDRRTFGGPELLAKEMKKFKNNSKSKLFSKNRQGARKRKRKRKRNTRLSASKSKLTRQGYTSTVGYSGLASEAGELMTTTGNPISNTIKQHFPSVLSNPLQLSSAVQKLIKNKINPQTSGQQAKYYHHNQHPQYQASKSLQYHSPHESSASQLKLFSASHGFIEDTNLPGAMTHWSPSEDSPAYSPSESHSKQHAFKGEKGKMIPIEIVGLDPAVASSILSGQDGSLMSVASQSNSGQLYSGHPEEGSSEYQPNGLANLARQPTKSSSILHIHHFHHQSKQAGGRARQQQEPQHLANYQSPQQNVEEQADEQPASSGKGPTTNEVDSQAQQQPPTSKVTHQQAFLNERGELVYLAMEEQSPDKATGEANGDEQESSSSSRSPSDRYRDVVSLGQLVAESPSEVTGDMEKHRPGGNTTDALTLRPATFRLEGQRHSTRGRQTEPGQGGFSQSDHPPEMGDRPFVMVAYKPVNATDEVYGASESTKGGAYNEGQESNHVSSSPQLFNGAIGGDFTPSFKAPQKLASFQDDRVALFNLGSQPQVDDRLQAQSLASILPDLLVDSGGGNSSIRQSPKVAHFQELNRVPSTLLSPFTSSAFKAHNEIVTRSPWLLSTLPQLNGYGERHHARPTNITGDNYTYNPQQNFLEKLALLRHIHQVNSSHKQRDHNYRQQPLRSPNNLLLNNEPTNLTSQDLMHMFHGQLSLGNTTPSALAGSFNITAPIMEPVNIHNLTGNRFEFAQASDDSHPKYVKGMFRNDVNRINQMDQLQQLHQKANQNQYSTTTKDGHHKSLDSVDIQSQVKQQSTSPTNAETFSLNDTSGLSNIALAFIFVISLITFIIIAASMLYRHRRRNGGRCADLTLGTSRLNIRTKRFMRSSMASTNDATSIKSLSSDGNLIAGKGKLSNGGDDGGTIGAGGSKANHVTISRRKANEIQASNGQTPLSTFTGCSSSSSDKYQFAGDASIKKLDTRARKPSYFKSLISSHHLDSFVAGKKQTDGFTDSDFRKNDANSCYLNLKQRPSKATSTNHLKVNPSEGKSNRLGQSFKDSNTLGSNLVGARNSSSGFPDSRHSFESKYNNNRMSTIHSVNTKPDTQYTPDQTKNSILNGVYRPNKRLTNLPDPKNIVASLTANYTSHIDEQNGRSTDSSQIDRL